MGKYTIKRIINMIPLLFVISIIIFLFIHLIPGDPPARLPVLPRPSAKWTRFATSSV